MKTKLLDEIEGLRNDIRALGRDFGKIRYEDLRRAFCDEVRSVVGLETQELLSPEIDRIGINSECNMKEYCLNKVRQTIEEGLKLFSRGDTTGALHLLSQLEALIESSERPCLEATCTERVKNLTKEVKILITIFDATLGSKCSRDYPHHPHNPIIDETTISETPEPLEIEKALMPLSNKWRIIILKMLSRGGMKFTEMSRTLGLRTGHLQFHLRVLARQGYLAVEGGSKTYVITERGRAVLAWAEAFASMLRNWTSSVSSPFTASSTT